MYIPLRLKASANDDIVDVKKKNLYVFCDVIQEEGGHDLIGGNGCGGSGSREEERKRGWIKTLTS